MDRETPSWITGLFLGLVVVGTLWGSGAAWTAQVTLAWDPNREADLAGYRLYRGRSSGVFDRTVDVGNVTTFTDGDLQTEVAYYYVVTAYNTAGLESDPSNEVSFLAPNAPPTIGAIDRDSEIPQTHPDTLINNLDSASTGLALVAAPMGEMPREMVGTVSLQTLRGTAHDSGSDIAAGLVSDSDCPVHIPSIVLQGHALQLRHRTTPGQHCRLQSATRLTGPWTDVPESNRAADGQGNIRIEIPTAAEVHPQRFLRLIEIRPAAGR